jgi:hypothetical protein
MTIDLAQLSQLAWALIIIGQMIWIVGKWRRADLDHPNWTLSDRKQVRTFRSITLSSIAAAWAVAVVQVARDPDLINRRRPFLMLPLALTGLTLTISFIAPRRGPGGFRALMITGVLMCACFLATLALAWPTHQ